MCILYRCVHFFLCGKSASCVFVFCRGVYPQLMPCLTNNTTSAHTHKHMLVACTHTQGPSATHLWRAIVIVQKLPIPHLHHHHLQPHHHLHHHHHLQLHPAHVKLLRTHLDFDQGEGARVGAVGRMWARWAAASWDLCVSLCVFVCLCALVNTRGLRELSRAVFICLQGFERWLPVTDGFTKVLACHCRHEQYNSAITALSLMDLL